jgi:amidohydrolase
MISFRKELHQHPELSNHESQTAARIVAFLEQCPSAKVYQNLGGHGVAAVFKGIKPGKCLLLRAELDALAIEEANDFAHRSLAKGVSHKCGHDGHSAILLAVAEHLHRHGLAQGQVLLLFQPAEETGEGALRVLQDPCWEQLAPDMVLALHNLPGYPKHQIICKEGTFAAASQGMRILLKGSSAHAAEPHKGQNPAAALAEAIQALQALPGQYDFRDFVLLTITHAELGVPSFGISPGDALLQVTLRAYQDADLERLTLLAEKALQAIAQKHRLDLAYEYREVFAATQNNAAALALVAATAQAQGLDFVQQSEPFRWSEDFGQFTQRYAGAMFGLGAGEDTPPLHHECYDFPDEIAPTGIAMFLGLIDAFLNKT